jgi:hypothetical protein
MSDSSHGGGPIQFVTFFNNCSWREAMEFILSDEQVNINHESRMEVIQNETVERAVFLMPEKADNHKRVFAYLTKTRGIDKQVVNYFLKSKMIYQDTYNNVVFTGRDEKGKVKFASKRGTNTYSKIAYKKDVAGSNKQYSFCRKVKDAKIIKVFESPIDIMSYMSMYPEKAKGRTLLSLGGLSMTALDYHLENNPGIEKIILCLDNDDAGKKGRLEIYQKYKDQHTVTKKLPKNKDFNEDLCVEKGIALTEKSIEKEEVIASNQAKEPVLVLGDDELER